MKEFLCYVVGFILTIIWAGFMSWAILYLRESTIFAEHTVKFLFFILIMWLPSTMVVSFITMFGPVILYYRKERLRVEDKVKAKVGE